MGPVPTRVFLSYAREDHDAAKRLREELRAIGANVWFDSDALLPGDDWAKVIVKAIRESDYFVALLSTHSVSKRGVVQRELREALAVAQDLPPGKTFIIPVRLAAVEPAHENLKELQWVDLHENWVDGVRRLKLAILQRHAPPPHATSIYELVSAALSAAEQHPEVDFQLSACATNVVVRAARDVSTLILHEMIATSAKVAQAHHRTGPVLIAIELTEAFAVARVTTNLELASDEARNLSHSLMSWGPGQEDIGIGLSLAKSVIHEFGGGIGIEVRLTSDSSYSAMLQVRLPCSTAQLAGI